MVMYVHADWWDDQHPHLLGAFAQRINMEGSSAAAMGRKESFLRLSVCAAAAVAAPQLSHRRRNGRPRRGPATAPLSGMDNGPAWRGKPDHAACLSGRSGVSVAGLALAMQPTDSPGLTLHLADGFPRPEKILYDQEPAAQQSQDASGERSSLLTVHQINGITSPTSTLETEFPRPISSTGSQAAIPNKYTKSQTTEKSTNIENCGQEIKNPKRRNCYITKEPNTGTTSLPFFSSSCPSAMYFLVPGMSSKNRHILTRTRMLSSLPPDPTVFS